MRRKDGFTIIETLVAMSLISLMLILLIYSTTRLILNPSQKYRITAMRLAEKAMEDCLTEKAYYDSIFRCDISGQIYVIRRTIKPVNDEIKIIISISLAKSEQIIYALTAKRFYQ